MNKSCFKEVNWYWINLFIRLFYFILDIMLRINIIKILSV